MVAGALVLLDTSDEPAPPLPGLAPEDQDLVDKFVERASAAETLRAYRSDWKLFVAWCAERRYVPLPATPKVAAAYLSHLAEHGTERTGGRGLARASIDRRLAAIVFAHRAANLPPPSGQAGAAELARALSGIRRAKRGQRPAKKRAADGDVLRDMIRAIDGDSLRDHRDRALLAIGMAGAFRRSELVAIDVEHVTEAAEGLRIFVPHSKADQEGEGAVVVIPNKKRIAPVEHYCAWLAAAGIASGPVFRKLSPKGTLTAKAMSDRGVALVVKARAAAAGYDAEGFSGHSLRAGFLTEAGRQGANLFKMKEHSRHASIEQVSEYVRDHERFRDHAGDNFL